MASGRLATEAVQARFDCSRVIGAIVDRFAACERASGARVASGDLWVLCCVQMNPADFGDICGQKVNKGCMGIIAHAAPPPGCCPEPRARFALVAHTGLAPLCH